MSTTSWLPSHLAGYDDADPEAWQIGTESN
jgi:hypothetical protein